MCVFVPSILAVLWSLIDIELAEQLGGDAYVVFHHFLRGLFRTRRRKAGNRLFLVLDVYSILVLSPDVLSNLEEPICDWLIKLP
jgi:hypothetical protein